MVQRSTTGMRTAVLGGTFDPPHLAHLVLGAATRRALDLDRIVFMPAGEPWRKAGNPISPAAVRLRMVEAATAPLDWAEVSAMEVDRAGPTHTDETFEELARGGGEWWFILGADALVDLPKWHEPQRLLEVARLAVANRPGEPSPSEEQFSRELRRVVPGIEERIDEVRMSPLQISSTDLRQRVRDGRSTEFLLPEAVRELIDERGLYRSSG